jgi:hypothetical protein
MITTTEQTPPRATSLREVIDLCENRDRKFLTAVNDLERFTGSTVCASDLNNELLTQWEEWKQQRGTTWQTIKDYRRLVRVLWRKAHQLGLVDTSPDRKAAEFVKPTEWHERPPNSGRSRCSICGCGVRIVGEHRAALLSEGYDRRYLMRLSEGDFEQIIECGRKWVGTVNRLPPGPSARVLKGIAQACTLLATGKTVREAATAMGVAEAHIRDWQQCNREFWKQAYDRALANTVALVRQQSATDEILKDPDGFLAAAAVADRWLRSRGEALFPKGDQLTLSGFFEQVYRPRCLSDATSVTIKMYRVALRKWAFITGDPPLQLISVETLILFRDVLQSRRGLDKVKPASPNTVHHKLRQIQTLLDKAGPPGPRNRDATGIIERPPWIKKPREVQRRIRIVTDEQLDAVYASAVSAEYPRSEGVRPPAWWRALLVTAYNLGIRRRSLFLLRMSDVHWDRRCIVLRPEISTVRLEVEQW